METTAPVDTTRRLIDAASSHLPPRVNRWVTWTFSRYPGRLLTRTATACARIELFDRSMTIAAQFFTSMFPILLMTATWLGTETEALAKVTGMPEEATEVINQAVSGSSSAAFGTLGVLIVLVSATSLSRALTRAYAAIWLLPRPTLKLRSAWRWFAALLALALSLVATFTLTRALEKEPPDGLWSAIVAFASDVSVGVFVPWVLLARQVHPRNLLPGALVVATALVIVRPAAGVWFPRALEVSAERYGSLGVAFSYLAFLYCLAFCWLAGAVIGHAVATDEGRFGAIIRGEVRLGVRAGRGRAGASR